MLTKSFQTPHAAFENLNFWFLELVYSFPLIYIGPKDQDKARTFRISLATLVPKPKVKQSLTIDYMKE